MRPMRIALFGCGSIGQRHLRNLRAAGHRDLIAFDPAPVARTAVEQEFGVPTCGRLDEVWERSPEVVLVNAPSNLHVGLSYEAARRGCHLFIEKPLSHSLEGVEELAAETERRGLVTMVGCNMRFHPGPATVKRLLDEGAIGRCVASRIQVGSYLPRWRPQQDYARSYSASQEFGGAVLDCVHEIDLALWYHGPGRLVGAASVPAGTIGLATDGLAEIILRHNSGVLSNVHLNFVQRDYRRTCQMIGTEGTIYWDFGARKVDVFGPDGQPARSLPEPEGWTINQMYADEMAHFLACVESQTPTVNPIAGGGAVLRVALEVRGAR